MVTAQTVHHNRRAVSVIGGGLNGSTGAGDRIVALMLNDKGMIRDCNKAGGELFGCSPGELVWKHISVLLPQLATISLMKGDEINPRLRFLSHIGYRFDVIRMGGARFVGELFFHEVGSQSHRYLRLIICPVEDTLDEMTNLASH